MTVIVNPAITKPGRAEMIVKCNKVRNAVLLREREVRSEVEDEEDCSLRVISDTEGTSITMKPTKLPSVENVKNNTCMNVVGIDPKLASIVTLYSDIEDTEDTEVVDKCAPPRPEIPEDFVPRCGR